MLLVLDDSVVVCYEVQVTWKHGSRLKIKGNELDLAEVGKHIWDMSVLYTLCDS